ncbi:hypothetical protein DFH06DRAFT_1340604 [Mycena polygramma]|nr:hypothetical protein DFH06DRAFT_1340604 [Mycena polygramma]
MTRAVRAWMKKDKDVLVGVGFRCDEEGSGRTSGLGDSAPRHPAPSAPNRGGLLLPPPSPRAYGTAEPAGQTRSESRDCQRARDPRAPSARLARSHTGTSRMRRRRACFASPLRTPLCIEPDAQTRGAALRVASARQWTAQNGNGARAFVPPFRRAGALVYRAPPASCACGSFSRGNKTAGCAEGANQLARARGSGEREPQLHRAPVYRAPRAAVSLAHPAPRRSAARLVAASQSVFRVRRAARCIERGTRLRRVLCLCSVFVALSRAVSRPM